MKYGIICYFDEILMGNLNKYSLKEITFTLNENWSILNRITKSHYHLHYYIFLNKIIFIY
jgi:hypothetical protein